MKNLKRNTGIIAAILILSFSISCKQSKKETNSEAHSMMQHNNKDGHHNESTKKVGKEFEANNQKSSKTTDIIEAYLEIKNGLATDNEKNAAKGGNSLVQAFSNFDMSKLSSEAHKSYMEIKESAKEHGEHIIKSDIKHQREHFLALSTDIIDLVTLLGTEKTLYQDFCPMANNNKGGHWLSETKAIKNPYYGAKMLKCGSVKKQIN
ncbi:DUF3347 domain-containing protein [Polaribacter ponticola]|uniref:DUF3347 domain-containing protein n=1 Tax=Polaribacter ponticola TaxID=2978475 RepID=A0ABT5S5D9_9FLAO|nr:DUF3347 domain-containing protein [Polaribacter sp. MSW5]MDD7913312.1 DUF3347 domain-containing protein [Polaribacter sp. MSW5]